MCLDNVIGFIDWPKTKFIRIPLPWQAIEKLQTETGTER